MLRSLQKAMISPLFIAVTAMILCSCVSNPQQNTNTVTPPAPKYDAKTLNDQWRSVYGKIPNDYPRDNDYDFNYPQQKKSYPPPSPHPYYAEPQGNPNYGKQYPYFNPEADNSYYLAPQAPRPQGQAQNQYPQDNDSDYYYPLFFDSGG